MSAVEVTITGILFDKLARTSQNVVLIGEATLTGLGVGGGPIQPPAQPPGGGGQPPGIWPGPGDPDFPGKPPGGGGKPPGIWGGPIDPYPGHPLPEPPGKPPSPVPPPVSWKAVWHPVDGWIIVGVIDPSIEHPVPSTAPAST